MRAVISAPRTIGGRAALFVGVLAFFILFALPAFAQGVSEVVIIEKFFGIH